VSHKTRRADYWHEIVLVKRGFRAIVVCLSLAVLLFDPTDVAEAGPFREFFRSIRNAIAHPKDKPRSHRRSRRSHKHVESSHNESQPSDIPNGQTSDNPVASPSAQNVRWAKAASGVSQQNTELPYGSPVPGKPGLVTSPFAQDKGYVDVTGFPSGTAVQDPYTGKVFLTP